MNETVATLWGRLDRGEHCALVGGDHLPLPAGRETRVVRIDCAASHRPLGAMLDGYAKAPERAAPAPAGVPAVSVEVRRVLRAAAVVGDSFEATVVAALLGVDTLDVMEVLQLAVDEGVALDDRGGGLFRLPAEVADA